MIFLYGPPGSGKSALGQRLAQALGLQFVDLDERIESRAGCTIAEIFANQGEAYFRTLEKDLLAEVLDGAQGTALVALGGGALVDPANRRWVEDHGKVLFLHAPAETLRERMPADGSGRPLLSGDASARLESLLDRRKDHYASFPLRLDTSQFSLDQAVWEAQVLLGRFRVEGMGDGYDVLVAPGCLDSLGGELRSLGLGGPVALVSDENVAPLYAQRVIDSLQSYGYRTQAVVLPPGEDFKTMDSVSRLWEAFLSAGLERKSTVLSLGGGVINDLAGFAASAYLRGVPWVTVPTTILAMVDASLGGKTGADLPQGKNLVGAFHPPRLVLVDPEILGTLPEVEFVSGLAEVIKHGVIADPVLFSGCGLGLDALGGNVDEIVRRGMAVKVRIIQEDPYEGGRRAALNLGHTVGHAVETVSGFRLRHGEAVAVGMVAEARLAEGLGLAKAGLAEEISAVLSGVGLPTEIPPDLDHDELVEAMGVDKKRAAGKVRFALPAAIGEVRVGVEIED